ncbi:gastric triacylglycerol lipase-like isoform X2 [Stegodyphus dumicola]|nr:gastric triacylglycerol lipase-like isoform X2 [Stegodyphus dumicola]
MNFPEQSLGFILADAGYDVWLGNIRGNTYSRRHIKYTPDMKEFWAFSFDEMAKYDLPAMIDFVLNTTGQKQLYYVGHSQGTTSAFALLSESPEYNKKVKLFIGLAPVTHVGNIRSSIRYLAPFTSDINFLFRLLGINEFLPSNALMRFLSAVVCETKLKIVCENIIFLLCGTDYSQLNETRLGVYVAHTPAGASSQSIIHYAQMINSKTFQKYDYGTEGNLLHYHQKTPPQYYTENITTPVSLIWSRNDKLADPEDVAILRGKLKSLVSSSCVNFDRFNHLDFVWAINAKTLVYNEVLALLKKYSTRY